MIQLMQKAITTDSFLKTADSYQSGLSLAITTQVLPCYPYTMYNQAQVTMCSARNVLTG